MSDGFSHSDAKGIDREEHIGDDGRNRRAVGLFAKDPGGTAIELSAISTASGVAIPTYELNPTTPSLTLGSVTLNPSDSQIGSVTIFGNITTTQGMTTLFGGPNQIGSVTVSNFVSPNLGNVTLNQSPNFIGIVTVANPNAVSGNTTINPGPNQIGSVTISNTPSVAQSGSWDIRSALSIASIYGRVEQTNYTAPNTGNVTLNPSPSFIGIVTVANPNAVSGNTTINPGPNQIGSVTISNIPAFTQSGNWDVRSVLSLSSIYGNVGIIGTPNVSFTGLISLASGTEVKSLATIVNTVTVSPTGLISLASGTEVKSVATVNQGAAAWRSVVTISPRTDYIGLMSVSGNVAVSNWVSPNVGNVSLNASNAYIGLVTVANQIDVRSMLSTATIFAVVNTGASNSNVTLNPSPNFIGIATVVPIISSTVVNFLVSTASGGKTQFPTNTVRQGIIQAYSENVSNVFIGNSAVTSGISDARGMELQAGQAAGVEIDQTSKLYLALATGASGAVSFFGSS